MLHLYIIDLVAYISVKMFRLLAVVALFVGTSAFAPKLGQISRQFGLNAQVESFTLHNGRSVQVFDGDYGKEICADVVATSKAAISKKGSFSLCIPGGSVVTVKQSKIFLFFFWFSYYFRILLITSLIVVFSFIHSFIHSLGIERSSQRS